MTAYNCDQDYFDPTGVPDWGSKNTSKTGWKPWGSGGGGGLTEYWVNTVWDPGGPAWVYWETTPLPDPTGAAYPDPYMTGFVGCSGYRVASRRYR
jgi:hypothetical protein